MVWLAIFVFSICFKNLFDVLNPLNKAFQESDIDLLTATDLIFSARYDLKKIRNDNIFQNTVNNAKAFINASNREFEELKQMNLLEYLKNMIKMKNIQIILL